MGNVVYKGSFWIERSQVYRGELSCSLKNGVQLNLEGNHQIFEGNGKCDVVFGRPDCGGKFATLVENTGYSIPLQINEQKHQYKTKIFSFAAYISATKFTTLEQKFSSILFRSTNLNQWMSCTAFKVSFQQQTVQYIAPEVIRADLSNDFELAILAELNGLSRELYQTSIKMQQRRWVQISCKNGQAVSLDTLLEQKGKFECFLALAIGEPQNTEEVRVIDESKNTFEVYYRNAHVTDPKTADPSLIPFSYQAIKEKFPQMMQAWYTSCNELGGIINLYFGLQLQTNLYLEQELQFLTQVLEGYHRYRKIILNEEERKKRLEEVINTLDKSIDQWLIKKLKYAYAPTLKKRIQELLNECDMKDKILPPDGTKRSKQIEDFAYTVTEKRNTLTHLSENKQEPCATEEYAQELKIWREQLDLLTRYYFFKEMGFNDDQTARIFERIMK